MGAPRVSIADTQSADDLEVSRNCLEATLDLGNTRDTWLRSDTGISGRSHGRPSIPRHFAKRIQ